MDLETLLQQYSETLCDFKAIKEYLQNIKCDSQGNPIEVTANGCCYNQSQLTLDTVQNIIDTTLLSIIADNTQNTLVPPQELNQILAAAECACQELQALPNAVTQLQNINTNTDGLETLLQNIFTSLETPKVVAVVPISDFLTTSSGGYIPIGNTGFPPTSVNVTGTFTNPDSSIVNVDLAIQPFNIYTGINTCTQTLIKVWSDGTFTDLSNNPVDMTVLQNKVGYCRTMIATADTL